MSRAAVRAPILAGEGLPVGKAGRRLPGSISRSVTFRCSTNRFPVHPGSLHRLSCAYRRSSRGPRIFRTCRCPRAGLITPGYRPRSPSWSTGPSRRPRRTDPLAAPRWRPSRVGAPPRPARAACRARSARPVRSYRFPQADRLARQRISPGVDTYPERTAGELLDVPASGLGHDSTI